MNGVPGVMQFESNGGTPAPCPDFSGSSLASKALSAASRAVLNRLARCWFILARGATPSIAMNMSFCGLTMWKSLSRYMKIFLIISSSVSFVSGSFPCVQLWTIPFMSR